MDRQATWRRDALFAAGLAAALGAAWALRDWSNLSALRLPDTDDALRLQQVRDWINGQSFADLTQHRLGAAPGVPMHWSRIPDLLPALTISAIAPVFGRRVGELVAVVASPLLLFATALFLVGAAARRVAPAASAGTAMLIAAIAFPATAFFLPGRLDHHGLQVVLLLAGMLGSLDARPVRGGATLGCATAVSVMVGVEALPLFAVLGATCWARWCLLDRQAERRLLGFGAGLAVSLSAGAFILAGNGWSIAACDGFTRLVFQAVFVASAAPVVLALVSARLSHPVARASASAGVALVLSAPLWRLGGACAAPYAGVDPLVARLWLANVAEAQPLLSTDAGVAFGYAGLAIAGLAATLWQVRRAPSWGWTTLTCVQAGALVLALAQIRALPLASFLAAPALAALVTRARTRGALPLVGAWLASAGILYPIAGSALPAAPQTASPPDCATPAALGRLAELAPGRLLTPMDLGAWALAATPQHIVAAPYHRNNRGNRAMYDAFRGTPDQARAILQAWHVDHVALCRASFGEPGLADAPPTSLVAAMRHGRAPAWLRAMPSDNQLLLYEVVR